MAMYASSAGKSGGEYYTPQEVSQLLAEITTVGKKQVNKVYDPCCGSGSLLLQFAKVLGKENVLKGFYGQEINLTTYNLCRINMFLHDINYHQFNIAHGDTLTDPTHWDDQPFDAIVSNPRILLIGKVTLTLYLSMTLVFLQRAFWLLKVKPTLPLLFICYIGFLLKVPLLL